MEHSRIAELLLLFSIGGNNNNSDIEIRWTKFIPQGTVGNVTHQHYMLLLILLFSQAQ